MKKGLTCFVSVSEFACHFSKLTFSKTGFSTEMSLAFYFRMRSFTKLQQGGMLFKLFFVLSANKRYPEAQNRGIKC